MIKIICELKFWIFWYINHSFFQNIFFRLITSFLKSCRIIWNGAKMEIPINGVWMILSRLWIQKCTTWSVRKKIVKEKVSLQVFDEYDKDLGEYTFALCKSWRKYLFRHAKGTSMVNLYIVNALCQNVANSESCPILRGQNL